MVRDAQVIDNSSKTPGPTSGSGLPDLSAAQVAKWGQTRVPTTGYAVFGMDHPVNSIDPGAIAANDWPYADLQYTDADGYQTNVDSYGAGRWLTTAQFYDSAGRPTSTLDAKNTAGLANGTITDLNAGKTITRWNADIRDGQGTLLVSARTFVLDTWSPAVPATVNGQQRTVRQHTHYDYDEGAPNSNINPATEKPYMLVTTTTVGASAPEAATEDPNATLTADLATTSVSKNGYDPIDGKPATDATSGWVLGKPTIVTVVMANASDNIVRKMRYNADGQVVEAREPGSSGTDAGTTRTFFYTAAANTDDADCGNTPQWAGLRCWSGPAAAPSSGTDIPDSRLQNFDKWLNVTLTSETSGPVSGGATRTTTQTYLGDGRLDATTVATSGLTGSTALPTTQTTYDATTKVATGVANLNSGGTVTSRTLSAFDRWGRTTSYTDAGNNTTTTTYVAPGSVGAGSVATVSNAKGTTAYTYDGTDAAGNVERRGLATQLTVSGVGTYTAAYDATGNLTNETMPGSLSQQRTYDPAGRLTGLTYSGQGGTWLSFARSYNAAGQVDTDSDSTGRTQTYSYDRAARLTSNADLATNAATQTSSCTTRSYAFDARGNRTSLATATATNCITASPRQRRGRTTHSRGNSPARTVLAATSTTLSAGRRLCQLATPRTALTRRPRWAITTTTASGRSRSRAQPRPSPSTQQQGG